MEKIKWAGHMKVIYKPVQTINEFIDHVRLRIDVFVREQGFDSKWEPDENDKVSKHYIGLLDDMVVSVARCRETAPCEIRVERVAVHNAYRGKGVGTGMMGYLIREIKRQKPKRIWLRSEVSAQKFYEKCRFHAVSEPFNEVGVPTIDMDYAE